MVVGCQVAEVLLKVVCVGEQALRVQLKGWQHGIGVELLHDRLKIIQRGVGVHGQPDHQGAYRLVDQEADTGFLVAAGHHQAALHGVTGEHQGLGNHVFNEFAPGRAALADAAQDVHQQDAAVPDGGESGKTTGRDRC